MGRFAEPATLILLSLSSGPKHGYAMMTDIRDTMGVDLGPGTLYGAISKLVRLELIRPLPNDERARPYEITASGRKALADFVATWSPIVKLGQARLA